MTVVQLSSAERKRYSNLLPALTNGLPTPCPPPAAPERVAVMYGSQTGNAQSIAEGIHDGCEKKGIESTLLKCDAWKKVTLQ